MTRLAYRHQILMPQQESLKASRGIGRSGSGGGMSRLNGLGFLDRKKNNSNDPHYAVVIVRAKVREEQMQYTEGRGGGVHRSDTAAVCR